MDENRLIRRNVNNAEENALLGDPRWHPHELSVRVSRIDCVRQVCLWCGRTGSGTTKHKILNFNIKFSHCKYIHLFVIIKTHSHITRQELLKIMNNVIAKSWINLKSIEKHRTRTQPFVVLLFCEQKERMITIFVNSWRINCVRNNNNENTVSVSLSLVRIKLTHSRCTHRSHRFSIVSWKFC